MVISYKPGRGEKVHIYLDSIYTISTTADFWAKQNIKNNSEIELEEYEALRHGIEQHQMYNKALDLLSSRDYSRRELADKLVTKTAEKNMKRIDEAESEEDYTQRSRAVDYRNLHEQAEAVCDKLEELNLLDDERYARAYAAELIRNKHLNAKGVYTQLLIKGINKSTAQLIIDEIDFDDKLAISELLNTKFKTRNLNDEKDKRRTVNALIRLGYSYSDISSVISELNQNC